MAVFVCKSVYKLPGLRFSKMLLNLIEDFWELFLGVLTTPILPVTLLSKHNISNSTKENITKKEMSSLSGYFWSLLFSFSVFLVVSSSVATILGHSNEIHYKPTLSLWPELYILQFMGKSYDVKEPSLLCFFPLLLSLCLLSLGLAPLPPPEKLPHTRTRENIQRTMSMHVSSI